MVVKVKKLNDKAVIPFKKHDSDFCYDVVATSCEEIAPNVYRYGIGLAFQIIRGFEPIRQEREDLWETIDLENSAIQLSIDFRPRSSIWETGMILANSIGTVN